MKSVICVLLIATSLISCGIRNKPIESEIKTIKRRIADLEIELQRDYFPETVKERLDDLEAKLSTNTSRTLEKRLENLEKVVQRKASNRLATKVSKIDSRVSALERELGRPQTVRSPKPRTGRIMLSIVRCRLTKGGARIVVV